MIKYKEFSYAFGKECEVEDTVEQFVHDNYTHRLYDKQHLLLKSILIKMIKNGMFTVEDVSELFDINVTEIVGVE